MTVTSTEVAASISNALGNPDWKASIASIKSIVVQQIKALDEAAQITDTHYFNHSLVPDFIVDWPADRYVSARDVFVRLSAVGFGLSDDLVRLSREAPIILGVDPLAEASRLPAEESRDTGTLVTDVSALAGLSSGSKPRSFGSYLPAAILKGGQGFVDTATADNLANSAESVFVGATAHDRTSVADGVESLEPFLRSGTARQMRNFARIIWEATGGAPADFPISTEFQGINDEGLAYLLSEASDEDVLFWRAIGRELNFERLLSLVAPGAKNLRVLLASNLDRFGARDLLVKTSDQALSGARWDVERGVLRYQGQNFVAYFAQSSSELTSPDQAGSLAITDFRTRLSSYKVDEVAITTDRDTNIVVNSDTQDVSDDSALQLLDQDRATGIASAVVRIENKPVKLHFDTRRARGRSNAKYSLELLLVHVLPLLWDLHVGDRQDISEMITLLERAQVNPALTPPETAADEKSGTGEPRTQ